MINPKIEFTKVLKVKTPCRANLTDAGSDFFIPENSQEFSALLKEKNEKNNLTYEEKDGELYITIPAHSQILIPSGIKVNILDPNTYLQATEKSGVAANYHLLVGACIIDQLYRGMLHINLANVGSSAVTICTGQKIVQFIHREYISTVWEEVTNAEYSQLGTTTRGEGGFGSTGTF